MSKQPTITEIKEAAKAVGFEVKKQRELINGQDSYKISSSELWKVRSKRQMVEEFQMGVLFERTHND